MKVFLNMDLGIGFINDAALEKVQHSQSAFLLPLKWQ